MLYVQSKLQSYHSSLQQSQKLCIYIIYNIPNICDAYLQLFGKYGIVKQIILSLLGAINRERIILTSNVLSTNFLSFNHGGSFLQFLSVKIAGFGQGELVWCLTEDNGKIIVLSVLEVAIRSKWFVWVELSGRLDRSLILHEVEQDEVINMN